MTQILLRSVIHPLCNETDWIKYSLVNCRTHKKTKSKLNDITFLVNYHLLFFC